MTKNHQLTRVELELMEILWALGSGTVHDVMERLPADRRLAYTSVSTMLRILQQKNVLSAKKIGRQHIYQPVLKKDAFANYSIKKIIKQVFAGNSVDMVAYLVDQNHLTKADIKSIQKLLNEKKKEFGE